MLESNFSLKSQNSNGIHLVHAASIDLRISLLNPSEMTPGKGQWDCLDFAWRCPEKDG